MSTRESLTSNSRLYVSIIIPVYNDSERLRICLSTLKSQEYPEDFYEVIVVDNNSSENIYSVTSMFQGVKLFKELQKGSYAARNKGIRMSQGNVLAFTDSDCVPSQSWLANGVSHLTRTPNCGLVAGKIELFFQNPEKPTTAEIYDAIHGFPQKEYVESSHYGVTANLFTFKEVIDSVGLFRSDLASGGDQEWGKRVWGAGYKQVYADDVCISHPARYKLEELVKKTKRTNKGHFNIYGKSKLSTDDFAKESYALLRPSIREIKDVFNNIGWHEERRKKFLKTKIQKAKYILTLYFLRWLRIKQDVELYSNTNCQSRSSLFLAILKRLGATLTAKS